MADDTVNIRIKRDTWQHLHNRKGPGDSFDDVIRDLIDQVEEVEEGNRTPMPQTAD